ncbi:MAG: metal ABC transporter substrate-binding protein [Planctomycetota bacterium]
MRPTRSSTHTQPSTRLAVVLCGISLLLAASCGESADTQAPAADERGPLGYVAATAAPPGWIARRLLEGTAEVRIVAPDPDDPGAMLSAEQVRSLQRAELILTHGAHLETWIAGISLPRSRLHETTVGFADRFLQRPEVVTHSHGVGGTHSHRLPVSQTWLDPELLSLQAEAIAELLAQAYPDSAAQIGRRAIELRAGLDAIGARLDTIASRSPGLRVAAGPEFRYLLARMGALPAPAPDADLVFASQRDPAASADAIRWPVSGHAPLDGVDLLERIEAAVAQVELAVARLD